MVDMEPDIGGDVLDAIKLSAFAFVLRIFAAALDYMGSAGLLGYLFAGLLFGPQLADFVPETDAIRILGRIGVGFLLLEAGLHLKGDVV